MPPASGKVTKTRLSNGLTVLLKEVHTAPLASFWVWYRVGSRNELPGQTGVSHWVEHMMFKGTRRYPGEVSERRIARDGGVYNAMTWIDWTAYFETLPADKIDFALRLEADRMGRALFPPKEVASERTVIISERQGRENSPGFRLTEEVQAAAFRVHSYHHEVIGDMVDLETMTRDDLYSHYRQYYAPNNAIAVVVGDFKTRDMLARIQALFGGYRPKPLPARRPRPEPEQKGERRVSLSGEGETAFIEVGYHVPGVNHPDFIALVAMDSILGGATALNMFGGGTSNKSSRLYRALVASGLAANASAGLVPTLDPYLYSLFCTVRQGQTPEAVEAALNAEVERLRAEPVAEAELAKAIKQARALFAFGAESVTNQGYWLGHTELFASYKWFDSYLDRLAAVTVADVQRVAQKYLARDNRTVGTFVPSAAPAQANAAEADDED
ncbi:MAG: insulinase family protein [Anaerolineales bacterium]|nr:insulinase family protein [Anaerolineales bacterium]